MIKIIKSFIKKIISKLVLFILNFFDYFHKKKILKFLRQNNLETLEVFFDIGAHKGETIKFFKKYLNIKKVYAFEASSSNFQYLLEKIDNENIVLENIALGFDDQLLNFNQCDESSSSTFSRINTESKYYRKKNFLLNYKKNNNFFKTKKINTISLRSYIDSKNIKKIDLMKIDTEGYEFNILRGLYSEIKNIRAILFEHHYDDMIIKNYTFSSIHNLLLQNDFIKKSKFKMPFRKTFEYIYLNKKYL